MMLNTIDGGKESRKSPQPALNGTLLLVLSELMQVPEERVPGTLMSGEYLSAGAPNKGAKLQSESPSVHGGGAELKGAGSG